ncbi:DNA polymerase-4 [Clostridium pascui]|uniref:DNA polymerase IV n=1 Tax=Clostridium pascui TaxID=46609 RepID=UPI001956D62E|nr:DNA polymerase IV [Clostridium pascui]MBM7870372.1 DNA polymerase-4 [Clostridium pascui]
MDKVIMHVDMDAFFASVEELDNPKLKGRPIIVGGIGERGVVATCSYEARKYGVHSAMPIFMARKKCPMGIYLPTRHERYKEISNKVFDILYELTPKVEPVSIDEAYLDISDLSINTMDAVDYIKSRVKKEIGLTISMGISYNKFLAKLGSDWNKPNGIMIITKDMIPSILLPLPISKIHGIGKKSRDKLNNIGIYNVEDLYKLPQNFFFEYFGKFGIEIYERIRGIDRREVEITRERKSVGRETTLKNDIKNKDEMKRYLREFSNEVSYYLKNKGLLGKTITVKIKTSSFENHTRSKTLINYIDSDEDIFKVSCEILDAIQFEDSIRLIGLTVSSLSDNSIRQMCFFSNQ